ncbi:hypothetical protein CYMTET_23274 [Cymbomonas tetramitiformis]|uniref:Uncharacterized protein n=1 Tax=Cymbomonas tetramitiformis TaxID=36881 RepID=A0AAE0FY75_9CHLO|nr:hypothetical protein CYMTET_23274 [Cymbomonas tetramitiformis]
MLGSRPECHNIARLLAERETFPRGTPFCNRRVPEGEIERALGCWVESDSLRRCTATYCPLQPAPRSTIAVAFSPDGTLLASTHGDHTVKLICCRTATCLRTLEGHRRTPWVVRFHPTSSQILASGSLDHEVRIWNAHTAECINTFDFGRPIASLAFHAVGNILAIASGHRLYMWEYEAQGEKASPQIALRTRRSLRAVRFHPHGAPLLLSAEVNDVDAQQDIPLSTATTSLPTGPVDTRAWDMVYAAARAAAAAAVTGTPQPHQRVPSGDPQTLPVFQPLVSPEELHAAAAAAGAAAAGVGTVSMPPGTVATRPGRTTATPMEGVEAQARLGATTQAAAASAAAQMVLETGRAMSADGVAGMIGMAAAAAVTAANHTIVQQAAAAAASTRAINIPIIGRQRRAPQGIGEAPQPAFGLDPTSRVPSGILLQADEPVPMEEDTQQPVALETALAVPNGNAVPISLPSGWANLPPEMLHSFMTTGGQSVASAAAAAATAAASAVATAAINGYSSGDAPCTVKLRLWPFEMARPDAALDNDKARLTIPHAVLCSEMGAHFSPCGRYLAACVACRPASARPEDVSSAPAQPAGRQEAVSSTDYTGQRSGASQTQPGTASSNEANGPQVVYELRVYSLEEDRFGEVLAARAVRAAHCLTSIQFSPSSEHLLLAYGRRHPSLLRTLWADGGHIIPVHTILEVYKVSDMQCIRVVPSAEDEVNVACFHPMPGGGLAYGTKEGRLRILRHDCCESRPDAERPGLLRCFEDEVLETEITA